MVAALTNLWLAFFAGILAPTTAVCVLPLYPAFLAYLAGQFGNKSKNTVLLLGLMVTLGVISSMFAVGLIFTKILEISLTTITAIVSPIAFGILGIVSILMIFNVNIGKIFPKFKSPTAKNPLLSSFLFGFFFGAIVLPCNPATLIVLFAISTTTTSFILNLFNFILFGVGMAIPLLLFSIISSGKSSRIIGWLVIHKRSINVITGVIMLVISLYYLLYVFRILG